ncbi:MAG: MMPL family transporter, partial [Alphaproteobacteria bacterium]
MLTYIIMQLVDLSRRFAWLVIALALLLAAGSSWFVVNNFKINTDINQLLSSDLDWRKREAELEKAFPQKVDLMVAVVDGKTADATESAASALAQKMAAMPEVFSFVERPEAIPFFQKNGLLFLSKDEISAALNQIIEAQPLLGALSADPSLRGFFSTIAMMLQGLQYNAITYDKVDRPFQTIADTIEAALAGQDKPLAWQSMAGEQKPGPRDLRKFILTKPVLDYSALQPGEKATSTLRQLVNDLNLTKQDVRVRLTGPVPLNDEEFASVADGTTTATAVSGLLVFILLMAALRSLKIVIPIVITLAVGLSATTAFALAAIGSLNLISVAFAVMFIGIAVDFGIQFGVRYRDQHYHEPDHAAAMLRTARIIAIPLAMAAGSTALGFLAFIPTAYRGVSELGLIAGVGMIIAFILNITLLPALMTLTQPPAEKEAVGYSWAAPIDRFLINNRGVILGVALITALIGIGITTQLRFDFDPLNLKDAKTESVSTLFDLMQDPDSNSYTIEALRPSLKEAQELAEQAQKLPEVDHTLTLASFVPEDQEAKLALLADANLILGPTLSLPSTAPTPTDDENFAALKRVADDLRPLSNQYPSAARLMKALDDVVARHDPAVLQILTNNIVGVMQTRLEMVKTVLGATPISIDTITDDLRRNWASPDGRYLVQIFPKGNARDHDTLVAFTGAVKQIAPDASGSPVSIQESGRTVTSAFINAGLYAIVAIALLSL